MTSSDNLHTNRPSIELNQPGLGPTTASREPTEVRGVDRPENPTAAEGYERRDVNIRAILWLAGGVFFGTVLVQVGLLALQGRFMNMAAQRDPELSPLADPVTRPPPPRLQVVEAMENVPTADRYKHGADYQAFLAQQESQLNSYEVIVPGETPDQAVYRIPVDRAIELLARRGLPEVNAKSPEQDSPRDDEPQTEKTQPKIRDEVGPQQR